MDGPYRIINDVIQNISDMFFKYRLASNCISTPHAEKAWLEPC